MAISRIKNSGIKTGQLKYDNANAGYPPVMAAPTATAGLQSASISFTAVDGATSYTVISSPGSITATGTSSPITVTGLTAGTSYTFQVRATNPVGTGAYSASSNSVTPSAPFAATGGTITTPGDGFTYHTFTGGGTFTVTSGSQPAGVVLVVAGGGGGAWASGNSQFGGGGAGGVVYTTSVPFSPTGGNGSGAYTVTIGGGGAGTPTAGPNNGGSPGTDSSFTGLTTAIGGGGGGDFNINGKPGGSGGGWYYSNPNSQPGAGTPGQGFPGGSPDNGNAKGGGGAGGKGALIVPTPASPAPYNRNESSGGPAVTYFGIDVGGGGGGNASVNRPSVPSTWPFIAYGGANAGSGGLSQSRPIPLGGPAPVRTATAGTANRGGGGGGGNNTSAGNEAGQPGGSGIVIVRYPV